MSRTHKPSTALAERNSIEDYDSILLPIYTYFAEYQDHRKRLRMRQIYWIPTIHDELQGNGVVFLSRVHKPMADGKTFPKPKEGLRTMFHINSRNRNRLFELIDILYTGKSIWSKMSGSHQVRKTHLAFLDLLKEEKVIEDSYETSKQYFEKDFEKECKKMREKMNKIKATQPKDISPNQKEAKKSHSVHHVKII
ncbi:uncharacterized protein Bfra_003022 [Botrytis fragariae]|uniref:Uncharacterized protein n=1 Tax=Botrytis fragariae TaxID=1964551 RepID=A0A8H6ELF6_9HELO|nr:uncharacterized protein Bfra_003022 [Botrytis fragariae]KAF5876616.1 hypothetical protein Bfra_003022 [Botrytis fragariae]